MSRPILSEPKAQQPKEDTINQSTTLSLSSLPPVFVLSTHLTLPELRELEDKISELGAPLTNDATEAKIIIGKVETKRRAEFELRCRGIWTEDAAKEVAAKGGGALRNKRRIETPRDLTEGPLIGMDDSSTESEDKVHPARRQFIPQGNSAPPERDVPERAEASSSTKVLSLRWLRDSLEAGETVPMDRYIVYEGLPKKRPEGSVRPTQLVGIDETGVSSPPPMLSRTQHPAGDSAAKAIFERAKADAQSSRKHQRSDASTFISRSRPPGRTSHSSPTGKDGLTRPTKLLRRTTSEHEEIINSHPLKMPSWIKENKKYACERSTTMNPPNRAFIDQLKRIKLSRILTNDDVGVRAYSTSIASLAAYPYPLSSASEVLELPGCDVKIAHLFREWKLNGKIQAVEDFENDPAQKVLRLFYDIWGVGAATARDFYYDRGWRDLDDIVEQGWGSLSRVQQIGVKYFEELQQKISRQEVESIAETITEHARKVRDNGVECCIVGGYRRGKEESGDVDVILTHRDEMQTLGLVMDVAASLEADGWITHTLLIAMGGTKRGQQPIPARHLGGGHGFDTLDKALVIWQDINFSPQPSSPPAGGKEPKNPNPHRRVDIIIAPWRTIGCAIVGWTGATTFERDIRRYAKHVKGWKFDSSGVRVRATGEIVHLEVGDDGEEASTWQEAEKRVFRGFGLEWREPWERCTE